MQKIWQWVGLHETKNIVEVSLIYFTFFIWKQEKSWSLFLSLFYAYVLFYFIFYFFF